MHLKHDERWQFVTWLSQILQILSIPQHAVKGCLIAAFYVPLISIFTALWRFQRKGLYQNLQIEYSSLRVQTFDSHQFYTIEARVLPIWVSLLSQTSQKQSDQRYLQGGSLIFNSVYRATKPLRNILGTDWEIFVLRIMSLTVTRLSIRF